MIKIGFGMVLEYGITLQVIQGIAWNNNNNKTFIIKQQTKNAILCAT